MINSWTLYSWVGWKADGKQEAVAHQLERHARSRRGLVTHRKRKAWTGGFGICRGGLPIIMHYCIIP